MKRLALSFMTLLVATSFSLATPKLSSGKGATAKAFSGEIMDSQCAQMGSHAAMMKTEGAKDARECTTSCVKMGGKYVLYNAASKTTFQLDDQEKAKDFAGKKVKVAGTFDKATKTIHVDHIAAAS